MANPSWPGSLQTGVLIGYTEEPQQQAVSTRMDAGPAKVRQRFTVSWSKFNVGISCTAAQRQTFLDFWGLTCKGGAQVFDWKHPATGAAATMRFVPEQAPKINHLGPDRFEISFAVEILP